LAFLDEEDALQVPAASERGRREPRRPVRQQIVLRRLIAVGVGLLLVLLFGLGLKACFNARSRAALKDYVNRDVRAILSDSQQTSTQFFSTLDDPKTLTPLDYENEIKSDRGAADAQAARAEKLDPPGDMKAAHRALELTLQLRRDGLQTISDNVSTALAREPEARKKAIGAIGQAMRSFLASDVVYERIARPQMQAALNKHGIDGVRIPAGKFLPDSPDWLAGATVISALGKVSGSDTAATPGSHGLGLVPGGVAIGGSTLQVGTPTQVTVEGTPELDIQVQNQGSVEETDVQVTVSISGGAASALEGKIPRIGPGETQTVKIPITPTPPTGTQLTLEVNVQPVPGEAFQTNNKASYTISFG
jgi:hypothetical protein